MKHKHAEVLHAFADGIECEGWLEKTQQWLLITDLNEFEYSDKVRIKPEPTLENKQYYPEDTFDKKYLYVYNSLSRRESWLSEKQLDMDNTYGWTFMGKVEVTK